MNDLTDTLIPSLAEALNMEAEEVLKQSLQGFLVKKIVEAQCQVGQLYVEEQRFSHKYGMEHAALNQALEALEGRAEEGGAEIKGISLLEAVADSRWWEHVVEDLATARVRLEQLQLLQGKILAAQAERGHLRPGQGHAPSGAEGRAS